MLIREAKEVATTFGIDNAWKIDSDLQNIFCRRYG
jgi:hypothetical protein